MNLIVCCSFLFLFLFLFWHCFYFVYLFGVLIAASALKAKLNFDKVARKFLLKYDCEAKLMKLGAKEKVDSDGFAKVFEKEFIPEFIIFVLQKSIHLVNQ